MRRARIGLGIAWIVATFVSVTAASQAVGLVRNQVTDRPSPLAAAITTTLAPDLEAAPEGELIDPGALDPIETPGPELAPDETTTTVTSTTVPTTETTVEEPPPTTTTTAAVAPTTTTTTTVAPTTTTDPSIKTYQLVGGIVRLRVNGDQVYYVGGTPTPGFAIEVRDEGPNRVVVKFVGISHTSTFRAKVENGELAVETVEE